jgi:hypothetical protein
MVLDDRIADLGAERVTNRFRQLTRLLGRGGAAGR